MVVAVHKSSSLLLNLLQFLMSSIDDGSHTDEEYSRVGLKAVLFTCILQSLRLRLKKPRVLDAFATVESIFLCQVRSLVRCTPRYFPLSTTSSICLWNL